ncbi:MAG: VWA domain-containing protein [Acidobacteria bacterium]|nr:VWA domain-containing protein [Acidobacteriota bacterium]
MDDGPGMRSIIQHGVVVMMLALSCAAGAQENPLGNVHTEPPVPATKPADPAAGRVLPRTPTIHVESNLVLVPMTVTDERNRLVTGLERDNFYIYDNNVPQAISTFSTDDAPVSIGVIFDLSGSMSSKFNRARQALSEFMRTSNPQDEFFVIAFNDRPAVVVDYTSDVDDVDARMVMLKPEKRTALIDAAYLGLNKLKDAKYERKALLIISDGGDNRSRYVEGELRRAVRESDTQIYSIGIFDQYAASPEEKSGPALLSDICELTGGRMFQVNDVSELGDIASRISGELRNEYVVGFRPTNLRHDGNWRKLKVKLNPPPGLPLLNVHHRQGYYAPTE